MIKKAAVVVISGVILIVAVAFFIYPTPYKYVEFGTDGNRIPVRVNVITGKTEAFSTAYGWFDIKNKDRPNQD